MLNQVCARYKVAFSAWMQSLTHSKEVDPVGWARSHYCLKYLSKPPPYHAHFKLYWKTVICIPKLRYSAGGGAPSILRAETWF